MMLLIVISAKIGLHITRGLQMEAIIFVIGFGALGFPLIGIAVLIDSRNAPPVEIPRFPPPPNKGM